MGNGDLDPASMDSACRSAGAADHPADQPAGSTGQNLATAGADVPRTGPVVAVNLDLDRSPDARDPFSADVKFTIALETPRRAGRRGAAVRRAAAGRGTYFGALLDVSPRPPAGTYCRWYCAPDRETIGWSTADAPRPIPTTGSPRCRSRAKHLPTASRSSAVPTDRGRHPAGAPTRSSGGWWSCRQAPQKATLTATGPRYRCHPGERRPGRAGRVLDQRSPTTTRASCTAAGTSPTCSAPGANEILIDAGRERYAARGGDMWGWNLAPWHREPVASCRPRRPPATTAARRSVTDASWAQPRLGR